jgi:AraC-like DNA-binding protein
VIAEVVEYTEGNNFQQVFKKEVGVTPGEWRRNNLKNFDGYLLIWQYDYFLRIF